MRGEWAEFNPWQVPMGLATEPALAAIGVRTLRADTPADLVEDRPFRPPRWLMTPTNRSPSSSRSGCWGTKQW